MNDKKTKEVDGRESVSMLPGVTVGVMIAVIAFVLSFDALRLVFVSSGINPLLSWGGPLCVDGTILLCTWATWGFRKGHIRGRWYPWAGLVLFSLFSVTGNALHAWLNAGGMLPTWGAPAIMSIPPIALLYSTHLIVIIAGDRQDKLARTTGKAAGPDDGHAGPAAATPETAGTEPVRTENCISSSRCFVFSHVFFSGLGSCMHFPYFSGCAEVFLPNMRASLTRRLWPVNSRSRPWCTMRSMIAAASLSSAKTVPHLLNSMFVVNMMLRLS
ncbi:PF10935 family protein [Bifidobacterium longum subsp. longum 35B]|nr:PF10935 family protein [Bifidobacterium longum subsp. longum 35B]